MLELVRDAAGVNEYLLPPLPNTLYTRDTTCWIYGGVTLNPLYWPARHEETILTTVDLQVPSPTSPARSTSGGAIRPRTGASPRSRAAT